MYEQFSIEQSKFELTGADVNMKNDGGRIALHYAASKGLLKIAQTLVSHGSKLNVKDKVCSNFFENKLFPFASLEC